MAVGESAAVEFHVQPEPLGRMGDLHHAGDAAVLVDPGPHEVRSPVDDEIDMLLQAEDMLGLQDRRGDMFPQFLVAEYGHAAVLVRILQPEEPGFVAGPAHLERVRPGIVFAGGVDHEVHVVSNAFSHDLYVGDLALDGGVAPAVDLEGAISQVPALFGEVREGLGCVQAAVFVTVVRARVGRQGRPVTAEQLVDGRVVVLAREVPQRNVHRADLGPVGVPQAALQVVVDLLPLEGIAAQQVLDRRARRRRAAQILPYDTQVGVYPQQATAELTPAALLVHQVESVIVHAHVFDGVLKNNGFDFSDFRGHGRQPPSRWVNGSEKGFGIGFIGADPISSFFSSRLFSSGAFFESGPVFHSSFIRNVLSVVYGAIRSSTFPRLPLFHFLLPPVLFFICFHVRSK